MAKTVMGSRKPPRIKRGSQSYHEDVTKKDYKPGQTSGYSTEKSPKAEAARQAQIRRETEAANERRAKEKRQRVRKGYRAGVVAAKSDASNTPGEKAPPRGGGRAKAAATKARNIAKSKARGTHVGGKGAMLAQDKRNRARSRGGAAGFNPKLGRSSPTDFIRGGRSPGGIPRKKL